MSNKNIKLILFIFLVLICLLAAKLYLPKFFSEKSLYIEAIRGINAQFVQNVEIKKGSQVIELKKENNIWKVNDKKADVSKIQSLLSSLIPTTAPELIAQTDKRYQEFELTDELATHLKIDDKFNIYTGKYSGTGIYARIENSPMVYILKNISTISTTPSDWYDKTVIALDQTKVTKLSFKDNASIVLIKKDDKWVNESDGKEAKKDKVDSILSTLSKFTAQSLWEESQKNTYNSKPDLTLEIDYEGKSERLEFFKGDTDYLIKRQSDGERFVVSEYSVSSLISASKEVL